MVLAETMASEALAPGPFEVDGGGVEEHLVDTAEEIQIAIEEVLLDEVLGATGDVLQLAALVEFLPQPSHGPVKVMEGEGFGAGNPVVLAPRLSSPVAARLYQAVQDRQVDGAFDIELELTTDERLAEDGLDAGLDPEAAEDEVRADGMDVCGLGATIGVGVEDGEFLGETKAGAEERVELTGILQQIETAKSGEDALTNLAVDAEALGDLQILVGASGFEAEKHLGACVESTKRRNERWIKREMCPISINERNCLALHLEVWKIHTSEMPTNPLFSDELI